MASLFIDFLMLLLLQAVLGFDNLLYISLESKRAPEAKQKFVRVMGISVAVGLRLILLFIILKLVAMLQSAFWSVDSDIFHIELSGHALITLFGGGFILYTATKEIVHMLTYDPSHHATKKPGSVALIITSIVMMNLVFSFDSILSAMAIASEPYKLTESFTLNQFWVMAVCIVISGILMIVLADTVTEFLKKNRMYEVVGLFILFIVGIYLLTEGAYLAEMKFFGHKITKMTKTTFYFVIAVLFIIEIVQGRYKRNLAKKQDHLIDKAKEKGIIKDDQIVNEHHV